MDGAYAIGQLKGKQVSTCLGDAFEGAKVFLHKLLRWSSSENVIRLNKYLIFDSEVWNESLMFVSGGGISCLSQRWYL